ncbi:MAG: 3'(2'),5'-bisphosphate nucleotidase, partial [Candidatus Hydrogenedentes bacterium]|nr:3'(2'),5'-bisphosphate nucleotidase [Candidatus Hydrogenedentota bacterium]
MQASRLIRHIRLNSNPRQLSKDDLSPVTVADFAAQALVAKMLEEHLPGTTLVGEEDAGLLKTRDGREVSEAVVRALRAVWDAVTFEQACDCIDRGAAEPTDRFWTLDPVDGTKGFLRGQPLGLPGTQPDQ